MNISEGEERTIFADENSAENTAQGGTR